MPTARARARSGGRTSPASPPHPIVSTKLRRPASAADHVDRDRLMERMGGALDVSLTLVSAPAGYGKSVLVSQWVERLDRPVAWLSLDEHDSDLRVFLTHFLAAIEKVSPGAGAVTNSLLSAAELPPVALLAGNLIRDLDALDEPCPIVLDDYHRIHRESPVHECIRTLLEHAPAALHLVLVSRRDPPLPLPRFRATNRILEIRLEELRFTDRETSEFLQSAVPVSFSETALATLRREVEGWAGGLRLVALALTRSEDPDAFLRNLRGGFAQTQDYLLQEVLAAQEPAVRDLILKASIFDRFSSRLLEEVCAIRDHAQGARTTLELLRRRNLFVLPLDARRQWFRHHRLFRELLKQQLARHFTPDEIAELHARASVWFESQGLTTESIRHAMAADDVERAATLVEKHRHDDLGADHWRVVESWLEMLPPEIKETRPGLLLASACVAHHRAQWSRIGPIVQRVDSLLDGRRARPGWSAELNLIRGISHYLEGNPGAASRCLKGALKQLAGKAPLIESEAELALGLAHAMAGDPARALQGLRNRMRRADLAEGLPRSRLQGGLVRIHLACGDLYAACAEVDRLQALAVNHGLRRTEAWTHYARGCTRLHSHDLDGALHDFSLATEQRHLLEARSALDALAGLALALQLLGQSRKATEAVARMEDFARQQRLEHLNLAQSVQARLDLLRGDLASAVERSRMIPVDPLAPGDLFTWLEVPSLTRARVLVATGTEESLHEATELLGSVRKQSASWNFSCQAIEAAVLQALALHKQRRPDEALGLLAEAVALARPGGWIRPFLEAGPVMAEMLAHLDSDDPEWEFVQLALAAFPAEAPRNRCEEGASAAKHMPDVLQLTNREIEVVESLAQRLSNKEIATQLFISTHTVSDHLKRVYQKLHVKGRRQAVNRAVELGLLTLR